MTIEALKFIRDSLSLSGINYEFIEYTSDIHDIQTYWIGEYSEIETEDEDGRSETQFILTGTTKGKWIDLESQKEQIKKIFPQVGGKVAIAENGTAIAIFYGNAFPVPTGDSFLKRMQINLIVKEWKVK